MQNKKKSVINHLTFSLYCVQLRNGLLSPVKSHSNGHIPNGLSNGSVNGHPQRNGNVRSGSVPLAIQGKSVFDTDADVDIATVAAQRDQLRGSKNIRGMMAPVMSKEVCSDEGFLILNVLASATWGYTLMGWKGALIVLLEKDSFIFYLMLHCK